MSTNKNKNERCESFNGFAGLDTTTKIGSGRLTTLKNFRLLSDGSAIKRSGFRHICTLDGDVRGEFAYADDGEDVILAAVGKALVRISVSEGTAVSENVFSSSVGSVKFFEFCGELYMIDGDSLYRYMGGCSVERCVPYIPLYGKKWSTGYRAGKINQPFNMLTPTIKITYYEKDSYIAVAAVGKKIKTIDAVLYNGEPVSTDMYEIDTGGERIVFDSLYLDGELEVYVTLDVEDHRNSDFESCDRVSVFDAFDASRIFMYGGENGGRTYISLPADADELKSANKIYGKVMPIYFPNSEPLRFSGVDGITDMCRIYDRMLIFSEHRCWVSSPLKTDEGRSKMLPMFDVASETAGCASAGATELINGDNPITVSHGGVLKWSIDGNIDEKMRLTTLSEKVRDIFDADFVKNVVCCYNRGENELWFANTKSENGLVVVYNCTSDVWYTFDGIFAERFLKIGENVAFRTENGFYIFDTNVGYDCLEWEEREFEAVIESAGFDFSAPQEKKHVGRCMVLCDPGDGQIVIELDDGEELATVLLDKEKASKIHCGVDFFNVVMRTEQSERIKFTLKAFGKTRQRIYRVDFYVD